jgi:hypothetical protein
MKTSSGKPQSHGTRSVMPNKTFRPIRMTPQQRSLIQEVLATEGATFKILDQDKARFKDWKYIDWEKDRSRDEAEWEQTRKRYEQLKSDATQIISEEFGPPAANKHGWDEATPCWASGGIFALWNLQDRFVSVFLSWDNPEDPSFLIVACAGRDQFALGADAIDPWEAGWMEFGEW